MHQNNVCTTLEVKCITIYKGEGGEAKEEIQRTKNYTKVCSKALVNREMQIKTTMKYDNTPARWSTLTKTTHTKCWTRCRTTGTIDLGHMNSHLIT